MLNNCSVKGVRSQLNHPITRRRFYFLLWNWNNEAGKSDESKNNKWWWIIIIFQSIFPRYSKQRLEFGLPLLPHVFLLSNISRKRFYAFLNFISFLKNKEWKKGKNWIHKWSIPIKNESKKIYIISSANMSCQRVYIGRCFPSNVYYFNEQNFERPSLMFNVHQCFRSDENIVILDWMPPVKFQ